MESSSPAFCRSVRFTPRPFARRSFGQRRIRACISRRKTCRRCARRPAKTPWAAAIVKGWHKNVDAHVARQAEDPTFAPSRLMMHWGEGRHYTQFTTDGNFVTGRSGNAPEPTIRVAYARSEERHRLLLLSAVHSRDRDAAPFAGELRRVLSDGRGAKCRAFEGSG